MSKLQAPNLIDGRSLDEWDTDWDALQGGIRVRHPHLHFLLGLYLFTLDGQVVAIGTGIDIRQGIDKRLYDFARPSWSGRNHHMGRLIYRHRDQLEVQVLIVGVGREAQRVAKELKVAMIQRHKPAWNVAHARALAAKSAKGTPKPAPSVSRTYRPPSVPTRPLEHMLSA